MSGSAQTVWPGQEVVQWPGQEVKAGQGEHGYAPAPPEAPPLAPWAGPVPIGDVAADSWPLPGEEPPRPTRPAPPPVDPSAPPPGDTQLTTDQLARERALEVNANKSGYFALEPSEPGFGHLLWSLGAPFAAIYQTAGGERPFPTGTGALEMASPLAGMGDLRFAPRVSPMMDAFDKAEAARDAMRQTTRAADRKAATEAQQTADAAREAQQAADAARAQAQQVIRPEPPSPDMTATPADRAPGFIPRVNVDPLTNEATTTQVPTDLRLRAAINAVPEEASPNFAPPGERRPPVQPGAAGPATIPPYEPPAPEAAPLVPPASPAEPIGPRSVGAAASRDITPSSELGLTPGEEAAYRSTAEGNKLLEPQEPGVRDDKQYLTGERINEAQASQDVEIARELNSLREQTPALDKAMTADENHNNNIRTNAIHNAIPGQVQITAARNARQAAMDLNEPLVFANAADADVRPIVKEIQDILNDPKNLENSQLRQYVRPLIARLQNPDGTPKITNPLQLWSWRQDVQHLTSGAAQAADPNLSRVSGLLGRVLDKTDERIEAAAPGYKENLRDEYRTRSREIDAMEALNAERFKLFDSQNKPNYNAVQSLMKRMIDARQANDPYDPFTHVTQDTLDKFWNIRDSMRRQVAVDRLGKPRGSPTSQNVGDAMRIAGKMALQTAAPAIGATLGTALIPIPGVGPVAGIAAGATLNHFLSARAMGQRLTRGLELTNPNKLMHPLP